MRDRKLGELARNMDVFNATQCARPVFLQAGITTTDTRFNATAGQSTTAKTGIDLSVLFSGVPAGIKAIVFRGYVNDSGSAATDTYLILSPNNTAGAGIALSPYPVNDRRFRFYVEVPCDAAGDLYFQVLASGAATFDIYLEVWGYYL
jgi:hypothetical protein